MLAGSSASKGTAMNIKIRTNLVSGILFLIFSIVLLIIIPKEIQQTYQQNQYISAKAIPQLIGIFMLIVSIYLIVQSIVLKKETIKELELKPELMGLVYILILAIYVALIGVLGFLVSSLLLSVVTMLWQKVRSWKQWAVSIAMAFIVYFAFTEGLGITFPTFLG